MRMIAAAGLVLVLASCSGEPATDQAAESAAPQTEAQAAYDAANKRMHEAMISVDADPDAAFMQGMLAHHKGAVEMSEVALKYGKDEKVRELAARIIATQQAEIDEMERWLRVYNATMEGAGARVGSPPAVDPHANH